MFNYLKLKDDVSIIKKEDAFFIIRGNHESSNCKVIPIPANLIAFHLLDELKENYLSVNFLLKEFNTTADLYTFYRSLTMDLFFEYKVNETDQFYFSPKFFTKQLVSLKEKLNKVTKEKCNFYIKPEVKGLVIDSPSSPFRICFDTKVKIKDLELEDFSYDFFLDKSPQIDFKDQLFLYEVRKREDIPKGTYHKPQARKQETIFDFIPVDNNSSFINLNLSNIPTIHRKNSKRISNKIQLVDVIKLFENVFSIQASVDDPYFGLIEKKYYPSAGSGYEIQPVLFAFDIEGLNPGVYGLNFERSSLQRIEIEESILTKTREHAKKSWGNKNGLPPAVIQLIFNPKFYNQKYSQICLSISFLNAGIIISSLYSAATSTNIGVCGLGSGPSDIWESITNDNFMSIAEIALSAD